MAMEKRVSDDAHPHGMLPVSSEVHELVIREATADDYTAIEKLGAAPFAGTRFFVAESDGQIIACLGEKNDPALQRRWLADWYSDGSKHGKAALLRLEQDFEARAKEDPDVKYVIGISEPQDRPNLQAAVDRGWSVLGVLIGKAV